MPLVVVGLSHHSSDVTVRERFAFTEVAIPTALEELRDAGLVSEGVILSTCNRVELYAVTSEKGTRAGDLRDFLIRNRGCSEPVRKEFYVIHEPRSVEHLFRVASGLDSMVLGETEILGQIKQAYELALQHRLTGGYLNKCFQKAFNVAKLIRSQTGIQRGSVSVGSVAVELTEKIFNGLEDRQVMVIGAGDTSEKTARSLLSRGARSIIVSNRSYERAMALAGELGGRAIQFEEWEKEFAAVDIVISSTSAPHYILDRARLEKLLQRRKGRPLLLIDIAVPRDIDPEVNFVEDVYLYNIDDLQAIADDYLGQRRKEVDRCEAIIKSKAEEVMAGLKRSGAALGTLKYS